ncbi:hypothetical protein RRG08_038540 [Elysia crispata]|uniref:Uncharacterized protein n=1 Tax=Elysia crispata TaxID=231223 RepID=A0AAE1E8B3_9GAST|nr:hypothetical protein RRG08_038540 [Elysia crispata]
MFTDQKQFLHIIRCRDDRVKYMEPKVAPGDILHVQVKRRPREWEQEDLERMEPCVDPGDMFHVRGNRRPSAANGTFCRSWRYVPRL